MADNSVKKACQILESSKKILVLTGAGISASAGIPTFRSTNGLWNNTDIQRFGSSETWLEDPWSCWFAYEKFRKLVDSLEPTKAHQAINQLSKILPLSIVTTNVDSLHKRSGTDAMEIHGTLRKLRCMSCGRQDELLHLEDVSHPACPACKNWRRHDVVLWNEEIKRFDEYSDLLETSDCLVLVGLSGVVTRTRELSSRFRKRNAKVIEINPETYTPATLNTNVSVRLSADDALQRVEDSLKNS